ncbi:hypothetical protein [Streptomyces sp. DH24]|uniref:hypothetical protein n=1 Tax=Streptomyces sp. DH24 TaxID=3040123 RepID=UPI00244320DA|nr:hypothetical protein [Streptomyces sp. DH24]MDG9720323.1 hypothetical protein [Streptomyces sp. DH24]
MSKRQIQKMLRLMASGEPVELTSAMASVKKLAKLAFLAQQFGYEYADVRQGGANNSSLVMLIVPDPGPHARARAAQNWAQYPNAGDGVSVPPFVPDALELLKARINFDLTGKSAEKRMALGALGVTLGSLVTAFQTGFPAWSIILWAALMAILGVGFVVTRRRNAKYAARLQAAGFAPVTDETGRTRYLPPGARLPGHGNPFGGGLPAGPYGTPAPGGHPAAPGYAQPAPGAPYPPQPSAPGPYAAQPAPGQYAAQPAPGQYPAQPAPAPGPYGAPPQAPPQQPYPGPHMPHQAQQPPYPQQQPHPPQQNPHWQPPQR